MDDGPKNNKRMASQKDVDSRRLNTINKYLNSTGPGDYDLPNLWSTKSSNFGKPNVSFSMRPRVKPTYMGKEFSTDLYGKDAPPANLYNTSRFRTIEHNDGRRTNFTKERRFPEYFKSETNQAPHCYIHQDFSSGNVGRKMPPIKKKKRVDSHRPKLTTGGVFPSSRRFAYEKQRERTHNVSPGPGMYATTSDFNKNLRKTKNGFGVSKKIESPIVHFKGME